MGEGGVSTNVALTREFGGTEDGGQVGEARTTSWGGLNGGQRLGVPSVKDRRVDGWEEAEVAKILA